MLKQVLATIMLIILAASQATKFSVTACFDTKCPVIEEGFETIVRYESCKPSLRRVRYCSRDTQYCVNNGMTGKGECRDIILTEGPPSQTQTDTLELTLKIAIPVLFILILICVVLIWRFWDSVDCCEPKVKLTQVGPLNGWFANLNF